jgi:hypothetical protein
MTYGPPAPPGPPTAPVPARPAASPEQRAILLGYAAGGLGVLSFVWGFLGWVTSGSGSDKTTYGGYALAAQGTAVVAVSLVAGGLAAAAAFEKRKASLVPVVIGAAALLLVLGQVIGKGSVSVQGGGSEDVGLGIGLILELITVILQVSALVVAWLLAIGRLPAARAQVPPQYPGYQPQPGYQQPYAPPAGYPQPAPDQPQYQYPQPQQPGQQQPGQQQPGQQPYPYGPPQR